MTFQVIFVMVFAVLGASAKPVLNSGFQSTRYSILNGGCGSLPVINTQVRTGVVETPTIQFPTYTPSTSMSETCHCFKTVVRPQIRNEIITVPTVDRIVRTVTAPIVETINCAGHPQITMQTGSIMSGGNGGMDSNHPQITMQTGNIMSGASSGIGGLTKVFQTGNNNGKNNGIFGNSNLGGAFSTHQGTNSGSFGSMTAFEGGNGGMMGRQIVAISSNNGFPGSTSILSSNSGVSNNGGISGF